MTGEFNTQESAELMPLDTVSSTSGIDYPQGGNVIQIQRYEHKRKQTTGAPKEKNIGEGRRLKILSEIDGALEHIRQAQDDDDPMVRATQAFYLEDCLKALWDMRAPNENEFKELVNLLYLNLKHLTLENITNKQLEAYALILDRVLRRTVKNEDFKKALATMVEHDIEPFSLLASND